MYKNIHNFNVERTTSMYRCVHFNPNLPANGSKWQAGFKLALECHITTSYQRNYTIIHTRAYKTNTHTTINEDTRPSMLLINTYTRNTYVSTGTQHPAAQPHSPHEMGLFPLELTYSAADLHFPLEIGVFRVPKPIVLHTI